MKKYKIFESNDLSLDVMDAFQNINDNIGAKIDDNGFGTIQVIIGHRIPNKTFIFDEVIDDIEFAIKYLDGRCELYQIDEINQFSQRTFYSNTIDQNNKLKVLGNPGGKSTKGDLRNYNFFLIDEFFRRDILHRAKIKLLVLTFNIL